MRTRLPNGAMETAKASNYHQGSAADVARDLTGLVQEGKLERERGGNSVYHYRLPGPPETPDLPRIHLQPGPLAPSVGVVLARRTARC